MNGTTGSISGRVTIAEDGSPLPGVLIEATYEPESTSYTAVTDVNGQYRILGVTVGSPYSVMASMPGFKRQTKKDLYVKLGEDLVVDFQLLLESWGTKTA